MPPRGGRELWCIVLPPWVGAGGCSLVSNGGGSVSVGYRHCHLHSFTCTEDEAAQKHPHRQGDTGNIKMYLRSEDLTSSDSSLPPISKDASFNHLYSSFPLIYGRQDNLATQTLSMVHVFYNEGLCLISVQPDTQHPPAPSLHPALPLLIKGFRKEAFLYSRGLVCPWCPL